MPCPSDVDYVSRQVLSIAAGSWEKKRAILCRRTGAEGGKNAILCPVPLLRTLLEGKRSGSILNPIMFRVVQKKIGKFFLVSGRAVSPAPWQGASPPHLAGRGGKKREHFFFLPSILGMRGTPTAHRQSLAQTIGKKKKKTPFGYAVSSR